MRGSQEFCGGDDLAGVALSVVGTVDEEASDGGGKGTAAYGSGLIEVCGSEGADAAEGGVEALVEFFEEGGGCRGDRIEFGAEGFELGGAELVAFGVGEEAIEAADDVSEVKGDGGEVGGAGVEGGVGERGAGVVDVLAGELEGVDNGAEDGGEIGVGVA
jgi:hypothetical protein